MTVGWRGVGRGVKRGGPPGRYLGVGAGLGVTGVGVGAGRGTGNGRLGNTPGPRRNGNVRVGTGMGAGLTGTAVSARNPIWIVPEIGRPATPGNLAGGPPAAVGKSPPGRSPGPPGARGFIGGPPGVVGGSSRRLVAGFVRVINPRVVGIIINKSATVLAAAKVVCKGSKPESLASFQARNVP